MSFKLKEVFTSELEEVNSAIVQSLSSRETLVSDVGSYLLSAGGKRIRPILTLLMSRICSYTGSNHIFLAAAVELIHAATLLHDDVVDQSSTRRSKPTANFIWDNKASILVGDFLFSQAFKLMVKSESIEALQSLSEASAIIAEGEVMQLARLYENRMLTVEEYEIIASAKTAALFAASSHVGAIIADQPAQVREAARNFGAFLGLIFQVKDDMLDYFANPNVTGKNLADDLTQGNITIPIILAYDKASLDDKSKLECCFFESQDRSSNFEAVKGILDKYEVKKLVDGYLDKLVTKAKSEIAILPCSDEYRAHLIDLLDYAANRNN